MKEIKNNFILEKVIKNSRFITLVVKIDDNFNLKDIINDVKLNYQGATHYCYAYKNISTGSFFDDGEPKGSAGLPIYNVICKNNLDRVLVVIVRYFGGIKLGASNLFRAYLNSASDAIKNCEIVEFENPTKIKIIFSYENENKIINYLKTNNVKITSQLKDEKVKYDILLNDEKIIDDIKYLIDDIIYLK